MFPIKVFVKISIPNRQEKEMTISVTLFAFDFISEGFHNIHNLTCNVLTPLDWVKLSVSCIIFCYPWFPCKEIKKYSMSLETFHPYKHIHQWPSCGGDLRRAFAQKRLQSPHPLLKFNFFCPSQTLSWIN